jgi:hypothetical protein
LSVGTCGLQYGGVQSLALAEGSDGAIRNYGTLHLDAVRVTDNFGAGTTAIVLNHGTLEASDSEIAYNLLPAGRRDTGTIVNYGRLSLRNTGIHDNTALPGHAGLAVAGAVLNLGNGRVEGDLPKAQVREAGMVAVASR